MKVFAVLLLATVAVGHYPTLYPDAEVQTQQSEWRQFYKFAVAKAMESCLGKDTVNKYTVNMKKAVAKCQQQEAPELDLPPYRSMYKFVNTMIKSADAMDQFKFQMMFNTMRHMNNEYDNYDNYDNYNNKHQTGDHWLQQQFMKYKMHQMMKEYMHEDSYNHDNSEYKVRPYSLNHKSNNFDWMKNNKMGNFEMMKMMKEIMKENRYDNKHEMMKMVKNFFGNEYNNNQYDMMEKYFKNENEIDAFEMMKMMMEFSGDESKMDMSQMMHSMEKMYGNDYKMSEHDMMKMMNEKNFDSQNFKSENYAPPQARYRFKRGAYNTHRRDNEQVQRLDKGDRLFAKLQEQKREHQDHVGNMTCVLKETRVLNKDNKIDVQGLKKYMQQYTMPSPWFKKNFEELMDVCYETAVNLPADVVDEQVIEGDFGTINFAQVRTFMKCCKEGKRRLCMNQDTKNKIESNFGPINTILKETKLTEYQLFPLVQEMLQGEESEYLTMI